ncbi:hypothetical protein RchiOBHm_Chr2g0144041 [Rosa chinensis]|uniref:Uncharacterized protein n=1 Tax=Rosa chinensis TaxID=74649 RepID=A0A2P6RYA1_ROSCH|nr:hypothetical protein RchiOBHm_Chr2g0144041 [Rosa chinensis]
MSFCVLLILYVCFLKFLHHLPFLFIRISSHSLEDFGTTSAWVSIFPTTFLYKLVDLMAELR